MRKFTTRQKLAVVTGAAAVAVIGSGLGAYAYWSSTGQGTATGTTGTSSPLTLGGSASPSVTPGGTTATVTFTVNNLGSGPERINTISLASVGVFDSSGNAITSNCDAGQYVMAPVAINHDVPSGQSTLTETGTLVLQDTPAINQDGCQGASLVLHLTSN